VLNLLNSRINFSDLWWSPSPRNSCVSMHLKRSECLLTLVDWIHHDLIDLSINKDMCPVLMIYRWFRGACSTSTSCTKVLLLHLILIRMPILRVRMMRIVWACIIWEVWTHVIKSAWVVTCICQMTLALHSLHTWLHLSSARNVTTYSKIALLNILLIVVGFTLLETHKIIIWVWFVIRALIIFRNGYLRIISLQLGGTISLIKLILNAAAWVLKIAFMLLNHKLVLFYVSQLLLYLLHLLLTLHLLLLNHISTRILYVYFPNLGILIITVTSINYGVFSKFDISLILVSKIVVKQLIL
jgi:hypothetical protein